MAEDIDLEKCNFQNFRIPVMLTLDRVEVKLVCISGRGLPTYQITPKSEKKTFCGHMHIRTDGWTHPTSVSLLGHRRAMT